MATAIFRYHRLVLIVSTVLVAGVWAPAAAQETAPASDDTTATPSLQRDGDDPLNLEDEDFDLQRSSAHSLFFPQMVDSAAFDSDPLDLDLLIPCESAAEWAFAVIPELFIAGLADSLYKELDDWAYACGPAEPVFRTAVLAAIWEGSFSEDLYDDGVLDHLLWYTEKQRRIYIETYGNRQSPYYPVATPVDDMPGLAAYDSFTADVAYQLEPHLEKGSLEEAFVINYQSGVEGVIFERLRRQDFAGSDLQRYYDGEVQRLRDAAGWEWGVYLGLWSPQQKLSVLGRHPSVGFRFGHWFGRWFLRAATEFRVLDSRSDYLVFYNDEAVVTDFYAALQLILEPGINLFHLGRFACDAVGTIGWETISYHTEIDDRLDSIVVGGGLQGRYLLDRLRGQSLFVDLRYEALDFDTNGGTELDGYAWNLRVGFSQALDLGARARLELLRGLVDW